MNQPEDFNTGIAWREWDESAFQDASSQDKPVLLTLGATWCHWCHVMDQNAYSDQRVIDLVNSRFIPVRVDVDQRPDISLRYNQGGYPSVAFLTAYGEFLAGRPYTPADEMVELLRQISIGELPSESLSGPDNSTLVGNETSSASVDAVMERLSRLYDQQFGGFGVEPKQPPWEALSFLTARFSLTGDRTILRMVEATLQGMGQGIYDYKDQGFFRYSVSRDWKVPHYEKMLVSNANLLTTYLEAYQVTRKTLYRGAAEGILLYLSNTLFDREQGLLFASQDADEPYYQMSWKDRNGAAPPPIDRTIYSGWNALAARAMIQAAEVLGKRDYQRRGTSILEKLWQGSWTPDRGLSRREGDLSGDAPILGDQVSFLRAWLKLYQSTGAPGGLKRAVEIAETVQQLFGAPAGGCYDTTPRGSFEAALLPREQPALDNSHWAEALLTLAELTGNSRFSEQAAKALRCFESVVPGRSYLGSYASRRMEEDEEALFLPAGAAWGRAKDMQTCLPVRLVLVGKSNQPGYRRLHRSALRIYAPHKTVLPLDSERDGARIRNLGFPLRDEATLYACMGERCLAPITTSSGVAEMTRARPWADG